MFISCRHWWSKAFWAVWPAWVWFCVIATANHFWLDVAAGIVVGAVSLVVVAKVPLLAGRERPPAVKPIANLL
jgi:membrane-associated phospholipid phosphatase